MGLEKSSTAFLPSPDLEDAGPHGRGAAGVVHGPREQERAVPGDDEAAFVVGDVIAGTRGQVGIVQQFSRRAVQGVCHNFSW